MTIELAGLQDLPTIAAFAFSTYKEVGLDYAEPDMDLILAELTSSITANTTFVYKDEKQKIQGCLVLQITSTWWSIKPMFFSALVYVSPEKRKSKIASELLKTAKEYAILNKMPVLIEFLGKDYSRKASFVRKIHGFKDVGQSLYFNP